MKKILILANDVTTILQFRCELISALVNDGNEVTVSVPEHERTKEIEALGAKVVNTNVSRHGKNPFKDIKLYKDYIKLIKEIRPDIVLTFTIKPNVYGGMACGRLKIPYVANVTGLGVVGDKGLLQKLMLFLYKKGIKKAKCVFFQNKANKDFFESKGIVGKQGELLPGSGVNVEKFKYMDYPKDGVNNIIFIGRIIRDKGVYELAEAAKNLEERADLKFTVLGDVEYGSENPFIGLKNVECVGYRKNVVDYLRDAHAIVLPSYHEGMANVLLEAASCGRVVIASNISGCQESFDEGKTGFGFEVRNADSLRAAINSFLSLSYEEKNTMGVAGRNKMEVEFDRNIVINKYRNQINTL
ncbi:MAG: glycosyltransferase family 4 protein [Clostridiales bacterium]|nr:glycosyltransferase family 4 protein [Clostridiales bacterium]